MKATVTFSGLDEVRTRLLRLADLNREGAEKAIRETAVAVHGNALRSIHRGSRSGRVYTRRGRVHQASAPGEPPKSDTGDLASRVKMVVSGLRAEVGTGLDYGAHLEFGTSKMAARPWLFPALEAERQRFIARLQRFISDALKR